MKTISKNFQSFGEIPKCARQLKIETKNERTYLVPEINPLVITPLGGADCVML